MEKSSTIENSIIYDEKADRLFNKLVMDFCKYIKCDAASLYVLNSKETSLDLKYSTGYESGVLEKHINYKIGEGLTGLVVKCRKPILGTFPNTKKPDSFNNKNFIKPKSFIVLPLISMDGKAIGVLKAENVKNRIFTESEQELARGYAELTSISISEWREKDALRKLIYAFVLMPFSNEFDDVYKYGIKKPLSDLDITCERVDEIQFVGNVLEKVFNRIKNARFIIADMTGKNANVFYEVGYCHALNKEVILCTQTIEDIPFDLRGYNHIVYNGSIGKLENAIKSRILGLLNK